MCGPSAFGFHCPSMIPLPKNAFTTPDDEWAQPFILGEAEIAQNVCLSILKVVGYIPVLGIFSGALRITWVKMNGSDLNTVDKNTMIARSVVEILGLGCVFIIVDIACTILQANKYNSMSHPERVRYHNSMRAHYPARHLIPTT